MAGTSVYRQFTNLTPSERAAAWLNEQIRRTMYLLASDPETLLTVVAGGPALAKGVIIDAFHPYELPSHVPGLMYRFLCEQVCWQFGVSAQDTAVERESFARQMHGADMETDAKRLAGATLDQIEFLAPPTEKQIADSWIIEDGSSEAGKRWAYGDKSPQQLLDELVKH